MKRFLLWALLLLAILSTPAKGAELSSELRRALPDEAEALLEGTDEQTPEGLADGFSRILRRALEKSPNLWRQSLHGAGAIFLAAALCGLAESAYQSAGEDRITAFLPAVGALSVTALAAGSLDTLMGLGEETIRKLSTFSGALLPTMAAATAASGAVSSAALRQTATVFCSDLLIRIIHQLLLPLTELYAGVLTAACCLPGNRLVPLANLLKKTVIWILAAILLLFTGYLSMAGIFSGTVDAASVKTAKAAVSGAVPVVGGILAEASEAILAGAGMLRSAIGVFGVLGVTAVCIYPFMQMGIQYLLYKLTAMLAALIAPEALCRLIDGLGGAFGLILAMTGSCALLILISVLASAAAVLP